MADSFVHLHVHTEYSMLDGAARLKQLFEVAQKEKMPAVAMTDHGNMHGAFDFYKQATAAGVTPVIGVEAYVAPESRYLKKPVRWGEPSQKGDDVSGGGAFNHMTMWARDKDGLHNLFKLNSRASIEGYFRKPRMDQELIAEHAHGVIATTGCPSGAVQTRLRLGQFDEALKVAGEYRDIFGKENFFVELMDHGLDIETRVREDLLRIAKQLDLRFVVTNDSHYTYESERDAHDALLCIQTGSQLADPNRFKFGGSGYFLKSADAMRAIDRSDAWLEGCRNTLLIAEMVDTSGMFDYYDLMPKYPIPEGETEESYFRAEVLRGLERRFPQGVPEDYIRQAEYEIDVIIQKRYPSYFLVVADFINWAKENGIRVGPGRGSAAGSLLAYALGITDLDPLPHSLIFERFLNPERESPPDIDIDFDERRRGDVIRYVTEKYGEDKVAMIATFGTIKAKAAVKDASRVLGFPYALGDRISKAFPPSVMGKDIPLSGIFDEKHPRHSEAGELRKLYDEDVDVKKVMDLAQGLEGLIRQTGVHAAGVIMSSETITDHIPVMRRDSDGVIITQFDYPTCETLGLMKMDFLGLRNLTIIDDCLKNIEANRGEKVDLLGIGLDDKPTYDLLQRGDTLGVFQFDGGPMRSLLRQMKPDHFEDISAVGALYRPGPMGANSHINYALRKNGQQEITPIHPELAEPLKEILGTTYGLIVYQEQVMQIAQKVAGYTLGQADLLRRAMGKKKKEVLDKEFKPFSEGMKANGFSDEAIKTLWDILVPFSDYAFNKAHSAAYGLVSYWTAYLKANYAAEYMAGLLTSVGDDKDKSALYLNECRRMRIKVLPPDVNESDSTFTPRGSDEIRFGLSAIRNVGGNVVDGIVKARTEKGKFTSFADFLDKVPAQVCNKRVVESLVKAGAFDEFGHPRKGLVLVHEQAIDAIIGHKRAEAAGQDSLFGGIAEPESGIQVVPDIPEGEWDKTTLLTFEREMLGLYVSDHPLLGLEGLLAANTDCSIAELAERGDGAMVTVGGLLSGLTRKVTKQGNSWAMAQLEDLGGAVDCMIFPNTYQLCSQVLAEDAVLYVKGRLDRREDTPKLIAMEVIQPDLSQVGKEQPVVVSMPLSRVQSGVISEFRDILTRNHGRVQVHLQVHNGPRTTVFALDDRLRVSPSPELMGDLKALLGSNCLGGV
ncbi:DNA polymerase III subunit alpha [Marinitenerispora sediminis]|uniref:DNA polymerase III subunit alpha n=1 Tax=Marinitenerispora sediminis TaxID=1931232 RepID=A0A368T3A8_9ACTN|nr:DNA polymerase III subunit alpha [Marinitenerispora sediminis]RCV49527.1 DNA polymerase III subunit alpha [Marinitenerispora sediminis]RCV55833.1 DNA polymerase III subunit alpha [Marinitenerispora sediminis]RCV56907.1 DNA polymerase III subunit alpha [Marinitenerispora sediminis]